MHSKRRAYRARTRPVAKALHAFFDRIAAHVVAAGLPHEAAKSLVGIDNALFSWRRQMLKSEMIQSVLERLDADIEPAEFEALTAAARLAFRKGGTSLGDASIGDIATELNIDPSRASRLVSALVQKNLLVRAVDQADARKTVLKLTKDSERLFDDFSTLKWHFLFDVFKDWSTRDIEDFERLLSRYIVSMEDALTKQEESASDKE